MTPSLHPEEIKAAIRMRFGSLRAFEEAKGLPDQSTRDVLRGRAVRRTALAISETVGIPLDDLFPGRFLSHIRDNNAVATIPHRINAGAR
jgi:lambda repressor-like predicted transcriptional regulator